MKLLRTLSLAALAAVLAVPLFAQGVGQAGFQFPGVPWNAYAPTRVQCGWLNVANFNSTADQAITLSSPAAEYMIDSITISSPSVSMTTAQGGFYTAASKAGVAVVASSQAYTSLTTNAQDTTGNVMLATLATAGNTTKFAIATTPTLYLSLTTAQGAAATANVRVFCRPMYPVN